MFRHDKTRTLGEAFGALAIVAMLMGSNAAIAQGNMNDLPSVDEAVLNQPGVTVQTKCRLDEQVDASGRPMTSAFGTFLMGNSIYGGQLRNGCTRSGPVLTCTTEGLTVTTNFQTGETTNQHVAGIRSRGHCTFNVHIP